MQGLTFAAVTASVKHTVMLESMNNNDKVTRYVGQGHSVIVYA